MTPNKNFEDCNCLNETESKSFLKKMKETESRKPTKKELKEIEDIKRNFEDEILEEAGILKFKNKDWVSYVNVIKLTRQKCEEEFINRTEKGLCIICKKEDTFSKENVCGDCSLKWLEKRGFLDKRLEQEKAKRNKAFEKIKEKCSTFISADSVCSVVDKIKQEEFGE